MTDRLSLYRLAERKNIDIISATLPITGSLSVQDSDGHCTIGIDEKQLSEEAAERVHLAHELGHCLTGSFYTRLCPQNIRQRHENRADKWSIRELISRDELDEAVASGYTELWSLAEHFGVTEPFMRKAICLYTYGNTAAELYF